MDLPSALLSPSSKSEKKHYEKFSDIFSEKAFSSGNKTFLYFLKIVFLKSPETELSSLNNQKIREGTFRVQKIKNKKQL